MTAIWKFPIPFSDIGSFEIVMPEGAQLLTVQLQNGKPMLWALVNEEAPRVRREFNIAGTWQKFHIGPPYHYVATWQEVPFVFHLLDKGSVA
jgi:hypothetical protein